MVAYLKKPTRSEGFQEIVDFLDGSHIRYALTKRQTATVRIVDNGEQEITATADGKNSLLLKHLQALNQVTELPQTSEPIPNVADEVVYEEWDDRVERATTTAASLDAEQASGNINRTQSTAMPNVPLPRGIGAGGSLRCQEAMGGSIAQTRFERVPIQSYDSPLLRVHTLRSDEGSMTLLKLIVLCTTLSKKVESLEADLKQTKKGWMIEEIDPDARVTLVTPIHSQEDQPEDQLGVFSAAKVLADAAKENVHTYTRRRRAVSTGSGGISTASRLFSTAEELVSTAGASMPVSIASMVQEVNINISSPVVIKDKGKGKMEESEDEQIKRTKLQQEQDRLGHEAVVRQQEELDEEERQRMARVHEAAQSFTEEEWENIRARVKADEDSKDLFDETTMKNVNTFVPMETEDRGKSHTELALEVLKATNIDFAEDQFKNQPEEGGKRFYPQEDFTYKLMMVVPVEEVYVEALQVKYPIIDWEVYTEESRKHWKIIIL
ncbi:hypothetical protein Tco_0681601 [Tanacetum coccineum]|uniref:Uncharacterized protein n=1 Tax=Tanacetum coccineum TaxID=301880 RepID=A0ABQ4XNU1_9ASTR